MSSKTDERQLEPGPLHNFGATLVLLRRLADKNQSEFAHEAGFGKAQLSAYEYGHQFPTMKTFERILRALKVTPLGFFYTMDRIARVAEDLQKSGKLPTRQLIGEPGEEGDEVFRRVVGELVRLIRAGRRKRREGE